VVVAAVGGGEGVGSGNLHLRPNEPRRRLQRQQTMLVQGVVMMSRHPLRSLGKLARDG